MEPKNIDMTGFENELGLKIDPLTGEAYVGHIRYTAEGEQVTEYKASGFTFEKAWVVGPGFTARFGRLALATKETAEGVKKWLSEMLPAKVEIVPATWDQVRLVDEFTTPVPQRMLHVEYGGKLTRLNAGLTCSNLLRTTPEFALEMVRAQLLG